MGNLAQRRAAQVRWLKTAMENMEAAVDERETMCADITEFKIMVENKERELVAQECKPSLSMPISQAGSSNVRLPKMEIKKFNEIQLFTIVLSGNAETAIRGLTLNAVNYETALTVLKEKFGDPQLLIEEHFKSLQNLPVTTNQWDLKRLEKFVNDMEINIRGLETLNTPPVVYQAMLMPLILSRLPREISVEWKRQNPNRQKDTYELLSFLKTELKSREVSTFPGRERKVVSPFPSNRKTVPRGQYTTAALQATVRKACFICEEDHAIENCPKFIRMSPKKELRTCRVKECSKRHHPLIHLNQEKRSVIENQTDTIENNRVHVTHAMRFTTFFREEECAEALSLKGPFETVNIESFGNINSECLRVRRVKFWLTSGQEGEPMAIHSTLGWIICDPTPGKVTTKSTKMFAKVEDHLDDILKNFWDMEAVGIKEEKKETDSKASQLFEKTVHFDGERYEVQLPWSNEESKLPNNYKQALDRLIQTERSLRRNPTKAQLYENE
ncbi:Microtubule organization protein AKNA [Trichinella spiralis]|uniref:Microtubule organization protein AKNA n=1 Tax=Trichinella spiralis TaxID=6334 RepID=A0ABR3KMV7_TRISP